MTIEKKNLDLFFTIIFFLILILGKNYFFCEYFSDCSLTQENYGGDLKKYLRNYYSGVIVNYFSIVLYLVFKVTHSWINFEWFLILFQLTFYSIIFFSGTNFIKNNQLWKFTIFIIVVLFYPFYDGYSSFLLKQGMGMIFLFVSIFLVKKIFSYSSFFFILLSIFSHYIFLLVYLVFYISKFFSLKFLTFIFLISISIYMLEINNAWYITNIKFLYNLDVFFIPEKILSKFNQETKFRFILFSSLPLFFLLIIQFKNVIDKNKILENLYKFHLLYSSIVYLFFSEFYYIDRFLSLTWIFYPFYLLAFLTVFRLNYKYFNS